jgi:protein phosphatase
MQTEGATAQAIVPRLNQLLLQQAAQLPLRLQAIGASDTGPQYNHNEDTCYPLNHAANLAEDGIFPRLAIVCDGIGGHEGGEVASQLAVQSIKLQMQAFLAEVAKQPEPFSSNVVADQLEAVVRVINNVIAAQNDNQGREARQRMGTTLVMALQLPQSLQQPDGTIAANSHELYLVNIGDSRAYWITDRYCHRLTIDDDVAVREVRMGRSLYREALQRSDAGALTQALGTRDAEFLRPSIQRFVIEEDGILLLCSDGLSDYGRIEESWADVMEGVLKGKSSLETAARSWIELANRKNGHDNASVVLLECHVSTPLPAIDFPHPERTATDWSESSRQLLQNPIEDETANAAHSDEAAKSRRKQRWWLVLGLAGLLLLGGLGVVLWSRTHPDGFQQHERSSPKP